jgi:tRNA threonylcarbamoyladenosine biosynthesis protein TsaE
MDIQTDSPEDLVKVVKVLLSCIEKGYLVVLLSGELGSGKTTLIQQLCKSIGITQQVTSPTFSIVQEYLSPVKGPIYHMDLYRLEKKSDLEQIGFGEYLDSGHLCLIEWPALGSDHYVMPFVRVEIEVGNNKIRNFRITTHDAMDT